MHLQVTASSLLQASLDTSRGAISYLLEQATDQAIAPDAEASLKALFP